MDVKKTVLRKFTIHCFSIFAIIIAFASASASPGITGCVAPPGVAAVRPDPDGVPTKVGINMYLIDLRKISETDQSYDA
ncbi:hypothetical protein ACFLU6_09405, partial [Acidobacteriota bacterium]